MLRKVFVTLLAVSALGGIGTLYAAYQIHQMQAVAKAEPQHVTLAEFLHDGSGDNAHLEVTQFSFGKPIVDTSSGEAIAWVPLYPEGAPARGRPPAVWRVHADESALPELLQSKSLSVIDAARMPHRTLWVTRAPARVNEEYPAAKGHPAAKGQPRILVLAEAQTRLLSWNLEPSQLFNPYMRMGAWVLGGLLALLGIDGLLWIGLSKDPPENKSSDALTTVVEAATLAGDRAISSHRFNTIEYAQRSFWLYIYMGGLGAFCLLLFVAGVSLLGRSPDAAYGVMGLSSLFLGISYWLFHIHNQFRTQGVALIDVCPTGIRWWKSEGGAPHMVSWPQITDVEPHHESPYPWRHFLVLTIRSGEVLRLGGFSLTDYHTFAKNLGECYQQRSGNLAAPPASGYQPLDDRGELKASVGDVRSTHAS